MGFFKSKKGSIISDYFSIETDLGQFKAGNAVDVALFPDHLELQNAIGNKKTATLAYSQITDIFYGSETQLQLKEKSPIARAFAGGLLFGSTGAFVGALSGLGKKEKKVRKIVFIISYVTADGQEAFCRSRTQGCTKDRRWLPGCGSSAASSACKRRRLQRP